MVPYATSSGKGAFCICSDLRGVRGFFADEIRPLRERLADLDEDGPEAAERGS